MSTPAQPSSVLPWRQTIPIDRLHPGKDNPRTDPGDIAALTEQIRRQGLKQPILVVPRPGSDEFDIEDGWRRYLAMKDGPWTEIPAVVVPYQSTTGSLSVRAIYTALITDVGKKKLNQIERAKGFERLQKEFGFNATEIAMQVGLSVSTVTDDLMLLMLDPKAQKLIVDGKVSATDMKGMLRTYRAGLRRKQGLKPIGPKWEPPWFSEKHPLAKPAEALCDRRNHQMRRRYGANAKVHYRGACGQCWQSVIEQDYEKVLRNAGWTPPGSVSGYSKLAEPSDDDGHRRP